MAIFGKVAGGASNGVNVPAGDLGGSNADPLVDGFKGIPLVGTIEPGQLWVLNGAGTQYVPYTPSGGGSGTVTTVSVASANGFGGTVANATTTPAITITTSVTGLLKGNGTGVVAGVAGTDYVIPSGLSPYAPLASPALSGTPTAPTATAGTATTQIATTAFVANSFAPLASPAFTGTPTAPTAPTATNNTQIATMAAVHNVVAASTFPLSTPQAGTLAANYTMTGAFATFMSTGSLAVGTWDIEAVICAEQTAANILGNYQAVVGSGAMTLNGATLMVGELSAAGFYVIVLKFQAVVTTAGIVSFQAAASTANDIVIQGTSGTNAISGWTASRIA